MSRHDPKFKREAADIRRKALIDATLSLIAEQGIGATTVRAIAEHAGVTQGLIRHYFSSKEELVMAAYEAHMDRLTEATYAPLAQELPPRRRLAAFISATLHPPVLDPGSVELWAGFFSRVRADGRMRAVHRRTYLDFRNRLEDLIGDALADDNRPADRTERRRLAIACNAVIDGLWLEGGALPDLFEPDELAQIGLRSVADIIGLDLASEDGKS